MDRAALSFCAPLVATVDRRPSTVDGLQYAFANQAYTVAGFPHLMHGSCGTSCPNGMLRIVACVSALISASHCADSHHGEITKPGRPSMICLNSS